MTYWITTDTHFGHEKMQEFCGRPPDFDKRISKHLYGNVKLGDVLIHLGDICIGKDDFWHTSQIAPLPAKKWLVRGNHDKKSDAWYLSHGWDMVCDEFQNNMFGYNIMFSHKPVVYSGYDINLHGHFHNTEHHNWEPELIKIQNPKQKLLVIENNNYMPWNLRHIVEGRV